MGSKRSALTPLIRHLLARDDFVVAEGSIMGSRLDAGERFSGVTADARADPRAVGIVRRRIRPLAARDG